MLLLEQGRIHSIVYRYLIFFEHNMAFDQLVL